MSIDVTAGGSMNAIDRDFQWQAAEGLSDAQRARIAAGNYGTIQDAVIDGDKVVVKTDLGTLTFSGPQLKGAQAEPSQEAFQSVGNKLPNQHEGVNMFLLMSLLFQTAQEERKAARQVRLAAMETAFEQNMAAADKLREGAAYALAGAIVSGVINIGMGAANVVQGVRMMNMASKMGGTPETESENMQVEESTASSKASGSPDEIEMTELKPSQQAQEESQSQLKMASDKLETGKQEAQAKQASQTKADQEQAEAEAILEKIHGQEMKGHQIRSEIEATNMKMQGWSSIVEGLGSAFKGTMDYEQQLKDADSKQLEAEAAKSQAGYDQANDLMNELNKMLDAVRDTVQAINQSNDEAMRTIVSA